MSIELGFFYDVGELIDGDSKTDDPLRNGCLLANLSELWDVYLLVLSIVFCFFNPNFLAISYKPPIEDFFSSKIF